LGQRDDGRALLFGDPPLASHSGTVAQSIEAVGVESVQPAAHLLFMAADLGCDRRDMQSVPAQGDDSGSLDPVGRGMPGPSELMNLLGLRLVL
jgi:hypothetical protein